MRKASDIVLLVGGILEILATLTFMALALVFMILASPASAEIIKEGLQNGTITTSFAGSVDEQVAVIQLAFKAMGVVFVVLTVFSLSSSDMYSHAFLFISLPAMSLRYSMPLMVYFTQ